MQYVDRLKALHPAEADDPLILGTALHTGLEKGLSAALDYYYSAFPIATDRHIEEALKLSGLITKADALIPKGQDEVLVLTSNFIGYLDRIVPVELCLTERDFICEHCTRYEQCRSSGSGRCPLGKYSGWYDLYDFKYSSHPDRYKTSKQLHLYKYYFEKANPKKHIRNMFYLVVPKVASKYKTDQCWPVYIEQLEQKIEQAVPQLIPIDYDPDKVIDYLEKTQDVLQATEYPKNEGFLCNYCDYKEFCLKGLDYMILPKNERHAPHVTTNPAMWIYAQSYVGKTTFIDSFDDVLFLNTDGNTDALQNPFIPIKTVITKEGRMTKRQMAWEVFLDVLDELEKKDNTFKIVCLDLIEDLYEDCRLFVYEKNGWKHESDAGYGKGWDIVKTEFLSSIKRLKAMGYQVIYISKEISGEVKTKGGGSVTTYRPNIPDKVANVLSGTVSLTARAFSDEKGRWLSFKSNEYIFGGSRFNFEDDVIPLDKGAFLKALTAAQKGLAKPEAPKQEVTPVKDESPAQDASQGDWTPGGGKVSEDVPPSDDEPPFDVPEAPKQEATPAPAQPEAPKRRTRRARN